VHIADAHGFPAASKKHLPADQQNILTNRRHNGGTMKFVALSLVLMVMADLVLAHGANTSHFFTFIGHFFHSARDAGEQSIFSK
jgi:hypothetical protein